MPISARPTAVESNPSIKPGKEITERDGGDWSDWQLAATGSGTFRAHCLLAVLMAVPTGCLTRGLSGCLCPYISLSSSLSPPPSILISPSLSPVTLHHSTPTMDQLHSAIAQDSLLDKVVLIPGMSPPSVSSPL